MSNDFYLRSLADSQVPVHNHESLNAYIMDGRPVGSFLHAVLTNNLRDSFGQADRINTTFLRETVSWLYNHAPCDCWQSPQKVEEWKAAGGLNGLRKKDNPQ